MNRAFLLNVLFLAAVNLIIKPFFIFGIDRDVQNLVGEAAYGTYFTLSSLAISFMILNDMGIMSYNTREIAHNPAEMPRLFPNMMALKGVLAGIYLIILVATGFILGYAGRELFMLSLLGLNQVLINFINYQRGNIAGLGKYWLNSFVTVLDRFLLIIVCGFLLWTPNTRAHFTINWFIVAQTITLLLTTVLAFAFIFPTLRSIKMTFDRAEIIKILRGSSPFAIALFLMAAYTRIDVIMLERILPDGQQQAGIYASAYRLLEAVNMLGFLLTGLLLPMFSKQIAAGTSPVPLLRFSFQIVWAGAWTVAIVCYFFRLPIMQLLYDNATPYSGEVFCLLMFSFVAVSTIYIFSSVINAKGVTRKMNVFFLVAILLNIGLNFLLIPTLKAKGAAIATLVTQVFVALCVMGLTSRLLSMRDGALWWFRLLSFVAILCSINWFIAHYLSINWVYGVSIMMGMSALLTFAFGFVNYKKIVLPTATDA